MTANAMRGDREMCLDAGMDDYLSKPVYLDELRASLERASERIGAWRAAGLRAETADQALRPEAAPDDDTDTPVVDRRRARSSGPELIDLFIREADVTFRRLRASFARGDMAGVREAAHGLKGTSGYVGAARVVKASARMECAVRAGQAIDASAVEKLEQELTVLRRELLTIFTELGHAH